MILPPRKTSVETHEEEQKRKRDRKKIISFEQIRQRLEKLKTQDKIRLHHLFDDEQIHRMCDTLNFEFRERVFTPAITLGLFVCQVLSRADACTTVMARFNRERKDRGLPPVSEDASGYTKARARLPVELINRLSDQVRKMADNMVPDEWKWNGLNVYLVDGFVLRAPDTLANQKKYPQSSRVQEGLGFPQVRVVTTTSLASGCVVHHNTAPVEGKKTGEVSLFREKHKDFKQGDIIVADSNLESFHDAALLIRRGVHMVCAINGSRNSPFEGSCETIDDQIVEVQKPKFNPTRFTRKEWNALPKRVLYRMIRYRVAGRETPLTVVTTLTDRQRFTAEEIAELYGWRWDVELDIKSYKSSMGMCELRCLTPESLDREIAVAVLGYNLVRVLMCDTAAVLEAHPREISFSSARDAWLVFHDERETTDDIAWMIHSAASHFVRNRPGRNEPRAIKRRQAKYAKLKEPRPSHRCRKKEKKNKENKPQSA
ncbi:MAG: IS4 family transposase [Planctomycetaceae bacterium]